MDGTTIQESDEQTPENQEELSPEELQEKLNQVQQEFAEYRKNSEKGVKVILDENKELKAKQVNKEELDALVQSKLDSQYVSNTLASVKNQLPESMVEAFESEFTDITEGKQLTSENVDKYIQKTLKLIGKVETSVVWVQTWATTSPTKRQENADKRKEEAKKFVDENGL